MNIMSKKATERYTVCQSCEQFRPKLKICGECNCFLPGKVHLEFASCPLQKWPGETPLKQKAEREKQLALKSE